MGETERATEVLRKAALRIDPLREPRQLSILQFNLAANLCRSEQFAEAEDLLPEVRELAVGLGNALDLVRVLWLQGKAHAGLGRSAQATAAFDQVLREFTDRKIPYDAALTGLELSLLYLEQGRTAEVQTVALGLAWIFTAEGVDEEALKALTLFYDAATQETATVELARRLVHYFDRACLQPGLPFEL
ncbi:MAG TPA: tetratricopeptide repeat protein, partial [Thermoanaerobaculia bacterium]|nr:tetratricopeptide repeat protein [Thermoanaerobaculia bacterium]